MTKDGAPYSRCHYSAGAILRGGNWNNGVNTGVFTTNLNNGPTNTNTNVGFRCVGSASAEVD